MRAADASLPITFAGRPRASRVAVALSPGVGSALLAWAADLVLGLPMIDASPVRVETSASLRLSSAPRRPRPRPPGLVRSNRQPRELRADPSSPVRSSPLPVVALRRLSASTLVGQAACRRSDTSPEVCVPLQHMPAAMRCPGLGPADGISADGMSLAGLRTIPLRRFALADPRAVAGPIGERSPVRFSALRRSKAASLEVPDVSEWFTLPQTRRVNATAKSCGADQLPSSSIDSCRCAPGEPVRTLASDPNTRAVPLQSAARTGSCTVAFLRRGVPLPSVSGLRSLAGRMVLPSFRPAALMGFMPFAVLSRHG